MSLARFGQQHIRLTDVIEWHRAIAAMVREGLTFEAFEAEGFYIIELTGGY